MRFNAAGDATSARALGYLLPTLMRFFFRGISSFLNCMHMARCQKYEIMLALVCAGAPVTLEYFRCGLRSN